MNANHNIDLLEVAYDFLSETQRKKLVMQALMNAVYPRIASAMTRGGTPEDAVCEVAHKLQTFMEPEAALNFAAVMLRDFDIDARTLQRASRPSALTPANIMWLAKNLRGRK